MGRWEPDARGRLAEAALDLYGERGFEGTTVAEIAERAGLTERTFFRHFADKREVLFWGGTLLQERLVSALEDAPAALAALDAVAMALHAAAALLEERRDFARRRRDVIAANVELQERELIKLATLASALAEGLRRRGVTEPSAALAAEAGMAAFRVGFDRWLDGAGEEALADVIQDSLDALTAVTARRKPARRR